MFHIDNKLIIIVIVILCVIICFRTSGSILCILLGAILIMDFSDNNTESNTILPSLFNRSKRNKNNTNDKETDLNNIEEKVNKMIDQKDSFQSGVEMIKVNEKKRSNITNIRNDMELEHLMLKELNNKTEKKAITITKEDPLLPQIRTKETYIPEPQSTQLMDTVIDGDENIAYNSIHRNEPTRVILGMGNAYYNLGRYVKEEVDEEESREWWGNNDY